MQLRLATELTGDQYVRQQAWREANLPRCPLHRLGGCGFARHGTYERVEPPGTQVARYYCPRGHVTFSLLPDCLASRLSSTLAEIEQVVGAAEDAGVEAAAVRMRPDIDLEGAVRWVRRRVRGVRAALVICLGLVPSLLAGIPPTLDGYRAALGVKAVLPAVRHRAADHLAVLPPPVGFGARPRPRIRRARSSQHETGPDPRAAPS